MQVYYFYQHPIEQHIFVQKNQNAQAEPVFVWIDCTREDVVNRADEWQKEIYQYSQLMLNEFHLKDVLNLEHPCTFDSMEDYDLLIFRKLITPDDDIKTGAQALEQHEKMFGLATTPVSFIITPQVLVTVREQGNRAVRIIFHG